ncbi:MAG: DUF6516 family protein [Chloroflexota bacterium]
MLHLFDQYTALFQSWQVTRYEQEGEAYLLHVTALMQDDSRLAIRDYLFTDQSRKYAYQWMEPDGTLRRRWDNAPHWPDVPTSPNHVHLPGKDEPEASTITNLEELFLFLRDWYTASETEEE